jgi:hypothetical protein
MLNAYILHMFCICTTYEIEMYMICTAYAAHMQRICSAYAVHICSAYFKMLTLVDATRPSTQALGLPIMHIDTNIYANDWTQTKSSIDSGITF